MTKKKAVLVGYDAAPSKAFSAAKVRLESDGWQVSAFLGGGKPLPNSLKEVLSAVDSADFVLVGMSVPSSHAVEEIAAAKRAVEIGKPIGLYADTFGAYLRSHFSSVLWSANLVFVINETEKSEVMRLTKNAKVVISGNHEWEDASFPSFSREEIRSRLGISPEEKLIVLAGHKSVPITSFLLMNAVNAVNQLQYSGLGLRVILAPHPGDGLSPKSYSDAIFYSKVPVSIVTKDKIYKRNTSSSDITELKEIDGGFSSSELLPAADLLMESASTLCQSAAIQRIPVISVLSEISKARNVSVFGQREWLPVTQGISVESEGNSNDLKVMVSYLLFGKSADPVCRITCDEMIGSQRNLYPGFRERGEFSGKISAAISSLISDRV